MNKLIMYGLAYTFQLTAERDSREQSSFLVP